MKKGGELTYCSKCGKYINYEGVVCRECVAAEEFEKRKAEYEGELPLELPKYRFDDNPPVSAEPVGTRRGLFKAISALVLSFVSFLLTASVFFVFLGNDATLDKLLIALCSLAAGTAALVLSILGIRDFRKAVCEGRGRHVVTLVLSIIALSMSAEVVGFSMFMTFLMLILI